MRRRGSAKVTIARSTGQLDGLLPPTTTRATKIHSATLDLTAINQSMADISRLGQKIYYFAKTFENMQILKLYPSLLPIRFHSLTCMVESRIFRIDPADRVTKEF